MASFLSTIAFFRTLLGNPQCKRCWLPRKLVVKMGTVAVNIHWIPRWIPGESPDIGLDMGLLMLAIERYIYYIYIIYIIYYIYIIHIYILYIYIYIIHIYIIHIYIIYIYAYTKRYRLGMVVIFSTSAADSYPGGDSILVAIIHRKASVHRPMPMPAWDWQDHGLFLDCNYDKLSLW